MCCLRSFQWPALPDIPEGFHLGFTFILHFINHQPLNIPRPLISTYSNDTKFTESHSKRKLILASQLIFPLTEVKQLNVKISGF